jgi:type IV secretory pathway TrbD component
MTAPKSIGWVRGALISAIIVVLGASLLGFGFHIWSFAFALMQRWGG